MATIITVHGTNATGPEEGSNWWQRASEFEHDVREFVQANDGKIDFKPLIWDGKNSETSRRRAGTKLLQEIQVLEKQRNKYCLLGHSHGGSVIGHSLVESAAEGEELKHLSRWITIGTPFIQTQMKRFLFSRMGLVGKSAYLSAVTVAIGILFYVVGARSFLSLFFESYYDPWDKLSIGSFFAIIALLPVFIVYAIALLLFRRERKRSAPSTLREVADRFGACQLALYHMNDEAVGGLRAMGRFHSAIFDRRFAVDQLILITAAIASFILIRIMTTSEAPPFPLEWLIDVQWLIDVLQKHGPKSLVIYMWFYVIPITFIWLYFWVFGILLVTRPILIALSAVLSRGLDRLTWRQIRRSAFGNDTSGETAIGSLERPGWSARSFSALPEEISCLLADKANEAAAQSIAKFRDAVGKLAFSSSEKEPQELVSEYVSWNELIHNVYFKTAIFRKLVCYAIAHSPGFAPSERLKKSPEYEKLRRWLEEIEACIVSSSKSKTAVGFPSPSQVRGNLLALEASLHIQ